LPTVTVKPADMQLILTPEPTTEVQSFPTQHNVPAQPPETPEVKPPTQQEDLSKLSELLEDNDLSPFQLEVPQEASAQPPEQPEENGSPSNTQEKLAATAEPPKEVETQHPGHNEVPVSSADQAHGQQPNLTKVIVQPVDVEITVTLESNMDIELCPTRHETLTQSLESFQKVQANLQLTITLEPTTKVVHSITLQKSTVPPIN
ncbi:PREDICTED: putative uncharacterized protein FLJ43826-like, partial [Elephantulus edwardii]|uniref:putative uncharacterized protein FLJ43826-like n=1 Tax=Elephantulus edwardii TaxID=28737 RepID=UPI0003F08D88